MARSDDTRTSLTEPRRILILAPHPDDEIVACGVAARRALARGASVSVLFLTTGVPARKVLWPWQRLRHTVRVARRRAEAKSVAASIGIAPLAFLETPSRQLRHHLDETAATIEQAMYASGAETVWVPAFEGAHQDHDAASALAARFAHLVPVYEFAAYNFAGGQVRSNGFPDDRDGGTVITLNAEEAAFKRKALAGYRSESGNLRHIETAHESWRPLPSHDYFRPPHPETLFRERFHWVPFRHPRIDFDESATVYDDIGRWAAAHVHLPKNCGDTGPQDGSPG